MSPHTQPSPQTSPRTALWIGFLAGGWAATLLFVLVPAIGFRAAQAEDPPGINPLAPVSPGPTINPINPGFEPRGVNPMPGGGTADSNGRAIALSASIGAGESAVYYFDTVERRLLVYQYKGLVQGSDPLDIKDKGGLRLLAARHFDYDLRLEGYRDLSQNTRSQLKEAFDDAFAKAEKKGAEGLATKQVDLKGGIGSK